MIFIKSTGNGIESMSLCRGMGKSIVEIKGEIENIDTAISRPVLLLSQ